MPIRVKKSNLLALTLFLPMQAWAQNAPAPAAPKSTSNNQTEIDSSTSTALEYLFHEKPSEGSTAKAGGEVASAIADKIKAVDVLKTPGLDDPVVRAHFQTYLSLKEVPEDRIKEYFAKMALVSETLKQNNTFGAWKLLYALSEYKDLDAGISRELANRVESFWNTDRTKYGLQQANDKLRDNIDTYDHNADLIAADLHNDELEEKKKRWWRGGG